MSDAHSYLLGENALVLSLNVNAPSQAQQRKLFALCAALKDSNAFIDIVPAKSSVTAYMANPNDYQYWLKHVMLLWHECDDFAFDAKTHFIETIYGGEFGPDLNDVAKRACLTERQVVQLHCSQTYQVEFLGFLPGFAYLGKLPCELQLPRKTKPRKLVPKGSVAIAEDLSAIYPNQSPGGWHLLGRCQHTLFNPNNQPPSLFAPGDKIKFVPLKEGVC
ncbi:5-oxoprolinase subunit PxpB [Pseudoalteromonas byunsanensis]|uniref:Carboxyltransferase domain-containing protein n=1 Tax=Pseudoalteromonas byunsanensis TaxID=327939 RepID=A0A1S1NCT0_9GAMM|nr:5-oxoprolinase subunit PxpB [Pseudoalteromonas byunsanensis]OHU97275.1 hypothetical protein BIW53_02860 [Pseudoalteromonas byunsanensis]